jgi:hypothetical protein
LGEGCFGRSHGSGKEKSVFIEFGSEFSEKLGENLDIAVNTSSLARIFPIHIETVEPVFANEGDSVVYEDLPVRWKCQ